MSYLNGPEAAIAEADREATARGSVLTHVASDEDAKELLAIDRAAPAKRDLLDAFGASGYHENPDGTWTLDVPGSVRNNGLSRELLSRQMDLEIQRGGKTSALVPMVEVRRADGVVVRVSAGNEELACKQSGSLPVIRYGGKKVRRMSDGLLWREAGNSWEPTGRCALTRPYFACKAPRCTWCGGV